MSMSMRSNVGQGRALAGALATLGALSVLTAAAPAAAEVKRQSFYLSALAGARVHETPEPTDSAAFQMNFRLNYNISERWGVQFSVDNSFNKETARPKNSISLIDMSADVVMFLCNGHAITPYIAGGPGVTFYKDSFRGTDPRMMFNTSAGFFVDIVDRLALRFDMRTVWMTGPVAAYGSPSNVNFNATVGLTLRMGGDAEKRAEAEAAAEMSDCDDCDDSDKDGIKDCDDACPTAAGTAELKGCPAAGASVESKPNEPKKDEPKPESAPATGTTTL